MFSSRFLVLLALLGFARCAARGAPLTFSQALDLALQHTGNFNANPSPEGSAPSPGAAESRLASRMQVCPVPLQDFGALAARLTSSDLPGQFDEKQVTEEEPARSSTQTFDLGSRGNIILCTALIYVRLEDIKAREAVLHRQQDLVSRLMDIESRRVSAYVDHPLLLTQAKLLRARMRMEAVALDASGRNTRAALSAVTGLAPGQIDPADHSMPPTPEEIPASIADDEVLTQLIAFRDVVQLDYVADFMTRLKVTHDMALAKASIGALVAAHASEEADFAALIQVNDRIRTAKIQFLASAGRLETWAAQSTNANLPVAPLADPESSAAAQPAGSDAETKALISLLIAPGIKELGAGRSQQYSVIATYGDGRTKDVTPDANWTATTDTIAVVSTTGLLTGLSEGEVTIHAAFQGRTASRRLIIVAEPPDEYLLPDRRETVR